MIRRDLTNQHIGSESEYLDTGTSTVSKNLAASPEFREYGPISLFQRQSIHETNALDPSSSSSGRDISARPELVHRVDNRHDGYSSGTLLPGACRRCLPPRRQRVCLLR